MGSTVSRYLRQNVLGLVAVFLALNAGAYAVTVADSGTASKTVFNSDLNTGSVDSRVIAQGGVTGPDIAAAAVGPHKMKLDRLVKFLQTRVNGACPDGQLVQSVTSDGGVVCAPAGAGTITGVTTGGGLTGGGTEGSVALGIDPAVIQSRVNSSCSGNHAVQSIGQNGGTACAPFVSGVTAGTGLAGGTISDTGTLSVDPTAVQSRVTGTCSGNQAVQSVNQGGTVGCQAITATGSAGGDLTGSYPNPTLDTGSIDATNLFSASLLDGAAGTATLRSLGTGAAQAAAGNDARLSDARPPTGSAGGDLAGTYPNPTIGAGVVDSANIGALPGGKAVQTSCQTVADDTAFHQLNFDQLLDAHGVTLTNNTLTVQTAGTYLVSAYAEWQANGTGLRAVDLVTPAAFGAGFDSRQAASGVTTGQTATQVVHLAANDQVTADVAQKSGGNLNLSSAGAGCAFLAVQWLGP